MRDDITRVLNAVARSETGAEQHLLQLVYDELYGQAQRLLRGAADGTMHATALVNEAYIRLFGDEAPCWENRRHFFFASARAMRDISVEYARHRRAKRRGGAHRRVPLDPEQVRAEAGLATILDVDYAMETLRRHDATCADVVLLRFFGGLTNAEVARALDLPDSRVRSEWTYARTWMRGLLSPDGEDSTRPGPGFAADE